METKGYDCKAMYMQCVKFVLLIKLQYIGTLSINNNKLMTECWQ